jgi:periplasmic protein TonB
MIRYLGACLVALPLSSVAQEAPLQTNQQLRENLVKSALEMAREQSNQLNDYKANPRVLDADLDVTGEIGAYLHPVMRKIEKAGESILPIDARRKLHGVVKVRFEISDFGRLIDARVLKSSQNELLDRAAIDAVRVSAPFQTFPESLRSKGNILIIKRDFTFNSQTKTGADND